MADIRDIFWHPTRTSPSAQPADLQVDFVDNTKVHIVAETDVSGMDQLIQNLHPILFP